MFGARVFEAKYKTFTKIFEGVGLSVIEICKIHPCICVCGQ